MANQTCKECDNYRAGYCIHEEIEVDDDSDKCGHFEEKENNNG